MAGKPGQRYLYSNLGYGVLAQVIEKAANSPFQIAMEQSVFEPVGMRRTTTETWVGDKETARGYTPAGEAIPYRYRLRPDGGAGFFANVHDLTRYALFHLGAFPKDMEIREGSILANLGNLPSERHFHYHKGWGAVRLPEVTVLISDGEMAGGTAALLLVPEKAVAKVVLCNVTGGPAMEVAVEMLAVLLPGFAEQFTAAVSDIKNELATPAQLWPGRWNGTLGSGAGAMSIGFDFGNRAALVMELVGSKYLLQEISWDRGTLQAAVTGSMPIGAGSGRTHNLALIIWLDDGKLRGVAQEEFMDDRPRFGMPYSLKLSPVSGVTTETQS